MGPPATPIARFEFQVAPGLANLDVAERHEATRIREFGAGSIAQPFWILSMHHHSGRAVRTISSENRRSRIRAIFHDSPVADTESGANVSHEERDLALLQAGVLTC